MSWRPDMHWTTVDKMRRHITLWLLLCAGTIGTAWAQGRYTPQGAAQRAWQSGEQLREAGDALRARKDEKGAREKYAEAIEAYLDAKKADPAYVDVYVKLGLLYFTVGRSPEALPLLEAGLKREAGNVDLQFWYGQNLLAAGKPDQGVAQLEALSKSSERYPEAHLVLGEHYYETGRFAQAAPALERYLSVKPDATAARATLGNTYFKLKLFPKALTAFETVRAAWPKNVLVQVNIGNSYFRMGQYRKAVAELQAALAKEPNRPSALFNLAQSQFKLGDFAAAKEHYQAYVKLQPKSFNGRYFLGSTLMELGEDQAAIVELAKAHVARPKLVHPIYKIGLVHLRAGRADEAIVAFEKARGIAPGDPWVLSGLGTIERQRDNLRKALALHSEAASLLPKDARLQANLALTASAAGSLGVAEAAIDKALAADSADPWVRAAAARVLALIAAARLADDAAAARQRLDQALGLAPKAPHLLAGRALARLAAGDPPGALVDARAAAAALPDDVAVRSTLGRALLRTGDAASAVEAFKAVHASRNDGQSAGDLGAALIAAGQADEAIDLLDSNKGWRTDPVTNVNRALAHYARLLRDLPSGGAQKRIANDLRIVLAVEKDLPPIIAARARYAAAINALRRGEGREARGHLAQAAALARSERKADTEAKYLRDGAGATHLDYLIAYSDALVKRYDAVKERLGRRAGALEKKLLRYVYGREGAEHFAAGDLKRAKEAFDEALEMGADPTIEHNLNVVLWRQRPKNKRVVAKWTKLKGKVPEALFNLGVAFEAAGDQREAWAAFLAYSQTGRRHADVAKEIADIKQRIYRFSEGQ